MKKIVLSKSLLSRNAIVNYLAKSPIFTVEELESEWILIFSIDFSVEEENTIKKKIFEEEQRLFLESQFVDIRNILYKKAFSPINDG